jgi:hypothetical protein
MERAASNRTGSTVRDVNLNVLRAEITMERVAAFLGFQA